MNTDEIQAWALQMTVEALDPLFEAHSRFWATREDIDRKNRDILAAVNEAYKKLVPIYNDLEYRGLITLRKTPTPE